MATTVPRKIETEHYGAAVTLVVVIDELLARRSIHCWCRESGRLLESLDQIVPAILEDRLAIGEKV